MMGFIFMGLIIVGGVLAYIKRCDLFKVDCGGGDGGAIINNSPPTLTVKPSMEKWDALSLKKRYNEYMTDLKQTEERAIKGGATDSLYASSRISYF